MHILSCAFIFRIHCRYLSDRTQSVKIGKVVSPKLENNYGVIQGSTLGPFLYLLYVNDISSVKNITMECEVNSTIYADDTNYIIHCSTINKLVHSMNILMDNLSQWSLNNGLIINTEKTGYMFFHRNRIKDTLISYRNSKVLLNNREIKQKKEISFLGVMIDEGLTYNCHVTKLIKHLQNILPICYRISNCLDIKAKKIIYYGLVESSLMYCAEIYGGCGKMKHMRLQIIQNYLS